MFCIKGFIFAFSIITTCNAATISSVDTGSGEYAVILSGPILDGDTAKLRDYIKTHPNQKLPMAIFLKSSSGSVSEGMRIGRYLKSNMIPAWSNWECKSACVVAILGSPNRTVTKHASLEIEHLQDTQPLREYLSEMDVHPMMVAILTSVPPGKKFPINSDEADVLVAKFQPSYEDWLRSACGSTNTSNECVKRKLLSARHILFQRS